MIVLFLPHSLCIIEPKIFVVIDIIEKELKMQKWGPVLFLVMALIVAGGYLYVMNGADMMGVPN